MTRTGTVRGTITYMAPEQAAGGAIDRRTDLFMAGELLYELLTLRPPYPDGVLKGGYVPPSLRDVVGFDAFFAHVLCLNAADRFASAEVMQKAIAAIVAPATSREIAAWVAELEAAPPAAVEESTAATERE